MNPSGAVLALCLISASPTSCTLLLAAAQGSSGSGVRGRAPRPPPQILPPPNPYRASRSSSPPPGPPSPRRSPQNSPCALSPGRARNLSSEQPAVHATTLKAQLLHPLLILILAPQLLHPLHPLLFLAPAPNAHGGHHPPSAGGVARRPQPGLVLFFIPEVCYI